MIATSTLPNLMVVVGEARNTVAALRRLDGMPDYALLDVPMEGEGGHVPLPLPLPVGAVRTSLRSRLFEQRVALAKVGLTFDEFLPEDQPVALAVGAKRGRKAAAAPVAGPEAVA